MCNAGGGSIPTARKIGKQIRGECSTFIKALYLAAPAAQRLSARIYGVKRLETQMMLSRMFYKIVEDWEVSTEHTRIELATGHRIDRFDKIRTRNVPRKAKSQQNTTSEF